ncbi:MAG: hypothetical protein H6Q65_2655 [Firmicutes bacterium]|nr:hypothetical protein [Bacillota bacterium]
MAEFDSFGKTLMILGVVLFIVGALFHFGGKIGLGHLPGDIQFKGDNWSVHFPLMTSIIISIILTILFSLFRGR